jgi:glutamine amidotransferase-like uncharacterized protein
MSDEQSDYPGTGRFRRIAVNSLLLLCGVAICLAWRYHRLKAIQTEERDRLIHSLAASTWAVEHSTTRVRVALFEAGLDDGSATRYLRKLLDAEPTVAWKSVSPADIQAGVLDEFDVTIFPGGNAPKQAEAIGEDGKQAVRRFVRAGGGYVGICGGAFLATVKYDPGMALINAKPLTGLMEIPEKGAVSITARGAGLVKMELTDSGKRVFGDSSSLMQIRYTGGPILSPAGMDSLSEYVSLATFRTEVWEYEPQKGTMIDTPAIIAGRFGNGRVIIFSPHPEMTEGLESLVRRAIQATAHSHTEQRCSAK